MNHAKTPIPEALSKRIEEMAEKYAESKRNYFCSECESFHTTKHYYKTGAQAMYQEMQAMLSERDAAAEVAITANKLNFEKYVMGINELKSQLKAAQEENAHLKSLLSTLPKPRKGDWD